MANKTKSIILMALIFLGITMTSALADTWTVTPPSGLKSNNQTITIGCTYENSSLIYPYNTSLSNMTVQGNNTAMRLLTNLDGTWKVNETRQSNGGLNGTPVIFYSNFNVQTLTARYFQCQAWNSSNNTISTSSNFSLTYYIPRPEPFVKYL